MLAVTSRSTQDGPGSAASVSSPTPEPAAPTYSPKADPFGAMLGHVPGLPDLGPATGDPHRPTAHRAPQDNAHGHSRHLHGVWVGGLPYGVSLLMTARGAPPSRPGANRTPCVQNATQKESPPEGVSSTPEGICSDPGKGPLPNKAANGLDHAKEEALRDLAEPEPRPNKFSRRVLKRLSSPLGIDRTEPECARSRRQFGRMPP